MPMPIERVHSFLVHPAKHAEEQPDIGGTEIPLHGSLYHMLMGVSPTLGPRTPTGSPIPTAPTWVLSRKFLPYGIDGQADMLSKI